eukprot:TRINITY_DN2052_c0_g2_i1.p1 TRINITY_DN2052_c0_g2~~TRINITY_DN2052_c0_g2_i1.p1  ORF type:complete len:1703 (+),score=366.42 TRINITY_DN2052_c0_g2_i1:56-5164(+)
MTRHPARGLSTLLMLVSAALMGRLPAEPQLRGSRRRLLEQQGEGPNELSPWLRAPVLQLCENRMPCVVWETPVKWLPTVQELDHFTGEEKSQRLFFFIACGLTATLLCVASIETLQFFVKKLIECKKGAFPDSRDKYRALLVAESPESPDEALLSKGTAQEAEQEEEHDEVSGQEKALANSIGTYSKTDVAFVYYHCLYNVMCSFLVYYAMMNDLVSKVTGLDFELYGIWVAVVLGVHFVTAVVACIVAYLAGNVALLCNGMGSKVGASLLPLISELVDGLRDPITVAIFLQSKTVIGYICAALTVIGMVLPSIFIFSDAATLRGLRHAYWPALTCIDGADKDVTASTINKEDESWEFQSYFERVVCTALTAADAATSPHRQELALEEESFQASAGLLFSISTQLSPLILLTTTVAVAKIACMLLLRKYILGWMANYGIPWKNVTTRDVESATACTRACGWEARSNAARAVAADASNGIEVRRSAMKSLTELLVIQSNADAAKLQEHKKEATACFTRIMSTQSLKAEAEKRLKRLGPYNTAEMEALCSVSMHWGNLSSSRMALQALSGLRQTKVTAFGYIFAQDVAKLLQKDSTRKDALDLLCSLARAAWPHEADIMRHFTDDPKAITNWYTDLMLAGCTEECNDLSVLTTDLLSKPDKKTQKAAAEAMGGFVQAADRCIVDLVTVACNNEKDAEVRQTALRSVESLWIYCETGSDWLTKKIVDMLSQFQDTGVSRSVSARRMSVSTKLENSPLISSALRLLRGLGDASAQAAPAVIKLMNSYDDSVQEEALKLLVNMGAAGKPYSKEIIDAVNVKENPQRIQPLLSRFQLSDELATFVVELFEHDSVAVKSAAALLVQFFDLQRAGGIDKFVALLKDDDHNTRCSSVRAFAFLGDPAQKYATDLAKLFKDLNYEIRCASPSAMLQLGDTAKPHVAAFVELLLDNDPSVAGTIAYELCELGALIKDGISALASGLKCRAAAHRQLHAQVLGSLGRLSAAHAKDLARCLDDREISVRQTVFQALQKLGWYAADARDEVARQLESQSEDVNKQEVVRTLISLGEVPPQLAERVCALFEKESNKETLKVLIDALPKIQYKEGDCSSHLEKFLLGSAESFLRVAALRTLPRLGKTGAEIAQKHWEKNKQHMEDMSVERAVEEALVLPQIGAVLEMDLSAQLLSGQLQGSGCTKLSKAAVLAGQHCKICSVTAKRLSDELQKPELDYRDAIAMMLLNAHGSSKDLCQLASSNIESLQLWGLRAMSCSSDLEWVGHDCLDVFAKALKSQNDNVQEQALVSIVELLNEAASKRFSDYFVGLLRQGKCCVFLPPVFKQLSKSGYLSCAAKLWRLVQSLEVTYAYTDRGLLYQQEEQEKVVTIIETSLQILGILIANSTNKSLPFEDAVVKYLSHTNARVRAAAARLISALGDSSAKHQPALKKLLSDASGEVRAAAIQSIGKFSSGGKAAISHAEAEMLLTRGQASDRKRTARALAGALGWELTKKLNLIEHEEVGIQAGALLGLSEPGMDYAKMDADTLKTLLRDGSPAVRGGAARLLGLMGAGAKGTAVLLAQMVSDEAELGDYVLGDGVKIDFGFGSGYAPGLYSVVETSQDGEPVIFKHDKMGYKVCNENDTYSMRILDYSETYRKRTDQRYSMTIGNVAEKALQRMGKDAKDALPELERMLQQGGCNEPTTLRRLLAELKEAQQK